MKSRCRFRRTVCFMEALEEDISSEDVTTNAVMPEAAAGQKWNFDLQAGGRDRGTLDCFPARVFELLEARHAGGAVSAGTATR